MIKGALFTIGILTAIGGFGMATLTIMAAMNSDAPADGSPAGFYTAVVFGFLGVAMIAGACFLK